MEEWPSLNTSKKCRKRLGKTSSMWTASCRVLWRRRHCLNLQTGYWTSSGSIAMSWKCKWGWIKPTSLLILILSSLRRRCEPRGRCWRWALPEFQLQIWVKRWRMWKIRRRWGSWTWWGWGKKQGKLLLSRSKSTWRPAAVKVCWSNKELFENHFYMRRSNGSVCSGLCRLLQVHKGWARVNGRGGEEVLSCQSGTIARGGVCAPWTRSVLTWTGRRTCSTWSSWVTWSFWESRHLDHWKRICKEGWFPHTVKFWFN